LAPTPAQAPAVVGASDETTGQGICAFVILTADANRSGADVVDELREQVAREIGKIALPRRRRVRGGLTTAVMSHAWTRIPSAGVGRIGWGFRQHATS
jgi:acyl-CoA synthetase (AMP-forming)/AMP-acid ligase II